MPKIPDVGRFSPFATGAWLGRQDGPMGRFLFPFPLFLTYTYSFKLSAARRAVKIGRVRIQYPKFFSHPTGPR